MAIKHCISCNQEVSKDFVDFKCPSCGKIKLIRCLRCSSNSVAYTCEECGFIGP